MIPAEEQALFSCSVSSGPSAAEQRSGPGELCIPAPHVLLPGRSVDRSQPQSQRQKSKVTPALHLSHQPAASFHLRQSPQGPITLGRCSTTLATQKGPISAMPQPLTFPQQMGCGQMQLLVLFPAIMDNIHEEDALAEMPVHSVIPASWNYWTAIKNSARHGSSCPLLEQE